MDQLNELYTQYGYHATYNSYYICRSVLSVSYPIIFVTTICQGATCHRPHLWRHPQGKNAALPQIAAPVSQLLQDGKYPTTLAGVKVRSVRDVTTGYDNAYPDNKSQLPQQVRTGNC